MKVLLVTDIPPCRNFTAGLVLEKLVKFLQSDEVVLCAVVNKALNPEISEELKSLPRLMLEKPREAAVRLLPKQVGFLTAFSFELVQAMRTRYILLPRILAFAREQNVDAVWVVLQGQTMVRLARQIAVGLRVPLFTQVWDPFGWWLRANQIDALTGHKLLAEFDKVIRESEACATASWSMSDDFTNKYKVRNLPVISGLSKDFARPPAMRPHDSEEFIIAMAGQFYAQTEWNCFIHTLHLAGWEIGGRRVRVRVMGGSFQASAQSPANFEYLGWQSQEESIRLLAESDLLYLPYWFSDEFKEESSNSFPSKLITYFAAGRPVFCHAPAYASPAKYIAQHNAGHLCQSLDPPVVLQKLEQVLGDTATYAKFAENGSKCFLRDFTLEPMRSAFFEFLKIKNNN